MPTIRQIVLGLVVAVGILFPGQAVADRAPHPEERSRIETMLRNEGYTHWGKIELDDDDEVWEVDNAYASVSNFGQRIANFSRFPGFDVVNPLVHKNGAAI